jgi:hypothetical protein
MKLPTTLGSQLLRDHFAARMDKPVEAKDAVAAFQRMCLVADLEMAMSAVKPWFKPEHQVISENTPEMAACIAVHSCVKQDVLSVAIDAVLGIANSPVGSTKDKLAAAAIINELYGERELITDAVLTDKLVLDLVGDGK